MVNSKRNIPTEPKKKEKEKWDSVNGKCKFQGGLIARNPSFVALFCDKKVISVAGTLNFKANCKKKKLTV